MAESREHQVDDPADRANGSCGEVLLSRRAEEDGESEGPDEGGEALPKDTCGLRVHCHPAEFDHPAEQPSVGHETDADTKGYADEAEHSVRQPCKAGDVVGVRQIPDTVHERNSRNQGHHGTNDDVAETLAEAKTERDETQDGGYEGFADAADNLRQRAAYEEAEDIEEGSDDEIGGAVHEAATEHGAESGGSEGRSENLFPSGLRRGGPDRLQPLAGLGESVFPGGDLIAQLVDFHYLGELYSTYGDEFHVGVPTKRAGCEYAVAEHEEMAGIHPVMRGDPFHRVLHTGDFRSVLKEDVSGYRGDFQNLGRVFCLNHSAKIQ